MTQSYKTAISFGLVYVPITLHACVKSDDVSFNTLYKKTGERIHYKKTCEHCPQNLNADDIVKGYQYEKDKYVVLSDNEIEKLKTPKDKTVAIETFVNLKDIDPIYFEKSYFVKPTGAENAYQLILKALQKENKVGLAKTVLGSKEQLVALREINGQMILSTMFFYDEIQENPVKQTDEKVSEKELSLAQMVIENMSGKFEPQKYKNEYREKLMKAIDQKIAGKKIQYEKYDAKPNNIINLMDALQKSVKQVKKPVKEKKQKKEEDENVIVMKKRA